MNSMTGFGCAEAVVEGVQLSVEIKSYNTRYLDMAVKLPSFLSPFEPQCRKVLQGFFSRGRLELFLKMQHLEEKIQVRVDKEAAKVWKEALGSLGEILGEGKTPSLELLARQEGVMKSELQRDKEALEKAAVRLVEEAAGQVLAYREQEGAALALDIKQGLGDIETALEQIKKEAPQIIQQVESGFRQRFKEILGDAVDENRILMETAVWIAKTDINEEVVRLQAHLASFREQVEHREPMGKKLDFLAQEMGREINTIGSKVSQVAVSQAVVSMKDALERVREQLRNVE